MNKNEKENKGIKDKIAVILLILSLGLYAFVAVNILKNGSNRNESYIFGYKPMVIVSGSMEPAIKTNSMVIVKKAPYEDMDVDDIILYKQGDNYIVHRVINKTNEGILTKGDNNNFDDGYLLSDEDVRGKIISIWNAPAFLISYFMVAKKNIAQNPYILITTIVLVILFVFILKKLLKKD